MNTCCNLQYTSYNVSSKASPCSTCAQDFLVAREHQVCSPLVPGKGNQEYGIAGARPFLLMQGTGQRRLVENASTLRLQESAPMGRAWSQGGVQKGSSLCAETFGAEIRRSARCVFCHPGSSQGSTHRAVSRPCALHCVARRALLFEAANNRRLVDSDLLRRFSGAAI